MSPSAQNSAEHAPVRKMLGFGAAFGAFRTASSPLVQKRLPTDINNTLGPRTKLGDGDHATCRVGGNCANGKAVVTNLGYLQLPRCGVATYREYLT